MAHSGSGFWRRATGISGSALFALAAGASPSAWALWGDRLELFAQENITYDSNVFRLSDRLDAPGGKSDTSFTTSVGANLDIPYSLQRFQAGFTWYTTKYSDFGDLDHDGRLIRANWLWSVTPRITGDVGYNETQALASFANIQSRRPDLVTSRQAYANGAWMAAASWRVHGAFTAAQTEHDDPVRAVNDIETTSAEAGLSYVTAAENRLGVAVRGERGRNPDERLLNGVLFDNEYSQTGFGVQGRWMPTGLSRFDGRADYTRRRYDQFTSRDYSGPTFRLTWTWLPTGKITVATTAQRDIAPLEDITTSFVLVKSLVVRPDWAVTDKITIRGNVAYAQWDYRGDPVLGGQFEHRIRTVGLTAIWRPTLRISLSAGVGREHRTSTLVNADYKVNTASIEARIGF